MQAASAPKNNSLLTSMTNPLIRKLDRIEETSEEHVTLNGVANKSFFFLAMIMLGVVLAWALNRIDPMTLNVEGELVSISPIATIVLLVSLALFVLTPILAFLIRATIPVTGTLYCFSTGYLFSFLGVLLNEYRGAVSLALVLTVAVVAVLAFLYSKRIVKVTQKFRTVVITLFAATIATSLLTLIASFIPGLQSAAQFVTANPLVSIGVGVVYVVIAALFLLVDFDAIERAIDNKIPRKYEWLGAFSLAFSVIWLFLKILSLIMKLKNSSSNS